MTPRKARKMTPKRKRLWLLLGSLCALGLAVTLVLVALDDNLVFLHSPTQIARQEGAAADPALACRRPGHARQCGEGGDDWLTTTFTVTDTRGQPSQVSYRGQLPDLFREGQGVIAEGTLGADGVFVAREVLAKHDENYMPPEVAKALKEGGRWNEGRGKK